MKKFFVRYSYIVLMFFSFFVLDVFIRYTNRGVNFSNMEDLTPNLFTLAWILLFLFVISFFKARAKKIIYLSILFIFQLMLLTNYVYYGIFGVFFSLRSIGLAGEATAYVNVVFNYIHLSFIVAIILSTVFAVLACHFMPKEKTKGDKIMTISLLSLAIVFYSGAIFSLGKLAPVNEWDNGNYKKNIYVSFTDTAKCMQMTGFYEYIFRDLYFSKIANLFADKEGQIKYLNKYFKSDETLKVASDWSEKYKDKNVIVVLMESIDDWLVTDEEMPVVSKLMKEGINFSNHYAPIYGSGATFNSEFMINTGYMTPLNSEIACNKYGNNAFPYSLANLLSNDDYTVNYFHFNTPYFYNRGQMSKAFGYKNYYSSLELGVEYGEAIKDSHFITNSTMNNLMNLDQDKTMDFVITYSAHVPYSSDGALCSTFLTDEEKNRIKSGEDDEEICIRAQSRGTDDFFKTLLDSLEKEGKLDDTVIIGMSDHYAYGFSDRERIYELKGTADSNLINKVPFFIWSSDKPSYEVTSANSNLDVLPTLAYLFGLDYNPKYYLGQNILDPNYDGFVFFGDYSWYDGEVYYKNNQVVMGENVDQEYINKRNKQLDTLLDINKKVLETNYFSTLSSDQ